MEKTMTKAITPVPIITKKAISGIVLTILSFFIGRITIFQGLNPIAISFLATFLYCDKIFFPVSIFLLPGFFLNSGDMYVTKYLICVAIMGLFNLCLKRHIENPSITLKSITGTISIVISGLIIAFLNSFSIYYVILAILEGILTFSLTYVLNQGITTIYFKLGEKDFDSNDILSLSILVGSVVAGSADIYMGNISIMLTLLMLLVMLVSQKNGSSAGGCSGILLSTVLMLTGSLPMEFSWIFGITGSVCGITKNMNKLFTVIAFIFSTVICFVYINGNLLTEEIIFSAILAIIFFLLIPINYFPSILPKVAPMPITTTAYILRIKDITSHRLKGFSDSFAKLSRTFSNLAEKKTNLTKEDVDELIDDIVTDVCKNCSRQGACWKNNFYNTYQIFFSLLAVCEKTGTINFDDIPFEFRNKCINSNIIPEITNKYFENYRLNLIWKNKIAESRSLVSNQISSISKIINNFSKELTDELSFDEPMSKKLTEELIKNGIRIYSVAVTENKDKKTEVIITHDSCCGRHNCIKEIIPIVNETLNKTMFKNLYNCSIAIENNKNICKLKLSEEQGYTVTTGVARATKYNSKESGDSHTFMDLGNGSYLLALSDGMGSGIKAKEESAASIELFENFMEAGFDKITAVELINSVLVLKSEPQNFSTLDICTINMYTGVCDLAKIGASETYIVSNDKTDVISSTSLPIGMLEKVDMETSKIQLNDNDLIVMVTDGISDCFNSDVSKNQLKTLLKNSRNKDPYTISELVLSLAKKLSNDIAKDDMTVLTAKIRKKI